MKTYILDSLTRYKSFSEALDVKTVLCNKSWWVFNDIGEKELYIFQDDGSLIISVSGIVTNATWQYVPANKSLIISADNQSYMMHPAFINNVIFALQLDGTEKCAFLIDENNCESFQPKTLTHLQLYFAMKEIEHNKKLAQKWDERQAEEKKTLKKKEEINPESEARNNCLREEAIQKYGENRNDILLRTAAGRELVDSENEEKTYMWVGGATGLIFGIVAWKYFDEWAADTTLENADWNNWLIKEIVLIAFTLFAWGFGSWVYKQTGKYARTKYIEHSILEEYIADYIKTHTL